MRRVGDLVARLIPSGGTTERAAKGGVWVMSQQVVARVLQLALLVVLARLIGPAAIGFVGVALLALGALRQFTSIGIDAALIQREERNVDDYLDTAWTIELVRGLFIATALVLAAPFLASVFGIPAMTGLFRVVALSPLLVALRNPAMVYFRKEMAFHKQFVYQISGDLLQSAVAVGWALLDPSVWAFVGGYLAGDAVRTIVSYGLDDYRPRLAFDHSAGRELIDFGKWLTASSILYFLYDEGDDALVGWLLSPTLLAFYQYAYRFSNAPATELGSVTAKVVFPAFSTLQGEPGRLRQAVLTTVRSVALLAFPASFGIVVVAPTFVSVVLGPDWTAMVLPMQILALYGLQRTVFSKVAGPVFRAIGRPDLDAKLAALRVLLIGTLIYPVVTRFGIAGTAALVTAVGYVPLAPLTVALVVGATETTYREFFGELLHPFAASLVMAGTVHYAGATVTLSPLLELPVSILLGAVVYVVALLGLDRQFDFGTVRSLRDLLDRVRGSENATR